MTIDELVATFRERQLQIDCGAMTLVQNATESPISYHGKGYIRETDDDKLTFRLYATETQKTDQSSDLKRRLIKRAPRWGPGSAPAVLIGMVKATAARPLHCADAKGTPPNAAAMMVSAINQPSRHAHHSNRRRRTCERTPFPVPQLEKSTGGLQRSPLLAHPAWTGPYGVEGIVL
jgi:hypothetical protein